MNEEAKQKMISKNQARPDYKTKLCKNFEEGGFCEYDVVCQYAHGETKYHFSAWHKTCITHILIPGKDELKAKKAPPLLQQAKNGKFKTQMCKDPPNCKYAEVCQFAHDPSELRKVNPPINDPFAPVPQMGGGSRMGGGPRMGGMGGPRPLFPGLGGPRSATPQPMGGGSSGNFKTVICKNYKAGNPCTFGSKCQVNKYLNPKFKEGSSI